MKYRLKDQEYEFSDGKIVKFRPWDDVASGGEA